MFNILFGKITANVWVYETFGASKRFSIKPLQGLLNVPPLKLALAAKCFIYRVVCWAYSLSVNYQSFTIISSLKGSTAVSEKISF